MWRCFLYMLPTGLLVADMANVNTLLAFICLTAVMFGLIFLAYRFREYKAFRIIKTVVLICFFALLCKLLAEVLYIFLWYFYKTYEWVGLARVLKYFLFLERVNDAAYDMYFTILAVMVFMPLVMCFDFKSRGKAHIGRGVIYLLVHMFFIYLSIKLMP
ncbi:MAG: hypothetical protein LUD81_05830 [Clostridiales bacterium]|nr:hypothetical protein [Clostridiales bacterium]